MRRAGAFPMQGKINRWIAVGSWVGRHWRGLLFASYAALFLLAALIAWLGYAAGEGTLFTVFALVALAVLLRFPRRLARSMQTASRARRLERRTGVVTGPMRGAVVRGGRGTARPPAQRASFGPASQRGPAQRPMR
jgi:hypothetical protein